MKVALTWLFMSLAVGGLLACQINDLPTPSPEGVEGQGSYTPPPGVSPGVIVTPEVIVSPVSPDSGIGAECGNNVVEAGEACEPGIDACCNTTCDGVIEQGVTCRAADGACDRAEVCDGVQAACPADAVLAEGAECRPSSGVCDIAEQCDGLSRDCPSDAFEGTSTVCRATTGACDVTETCNGASAACPANALANSETVCRAAAGICDLADSCDGISDQCPTDALRDTNFTCRVASNGGCDTAEMCTGTGSSCPTDLPTPAGTRCREPENSLCDLAEVCDGASFVCPPATNSVAPAGQVCRAAAGGCDVQEVCGGNSNTDCPPDTLRQPGFVCRASASACDIAETCGGSATCPTDAVVMAGTACNGLPNTSGCDLQDTCNGIVGTPACVANVAPAATVCRSDGGECDVAETCGGAEICPPNAVVPDGNPCFDLAGACSMGVCCPGTTSSSNGSDCNHGNGDNIVFLTSTDHRGALGGLAGGDDICQSIATSANLGGRYHAWLSSPLENTLGTDARTRISNGPYSLVDGTLVAGSLAELIAATPLRAPINRTEWNAQRETPPWTGTNPDGTQVGGRSDSTCDGWGMGLNPSAGTIGDSAAVDDTWSRSTTTACDGALPLYCFQDDTCPDGDVDVQTDSNHCGVCGNRCNPSETCIRGVCGGRVFVTSTTYPGEFFGFVPADTACNNLAAQVGLPGRYMAWLSTSYVHASQRPFLEAPYFRIDGVQVSDGLSAMISNQMLLNPIALTERGVPHGGVAWTGTTPDGQVAAGATCFNSQSSNDWDTRSGSGLAGESAQPGQRWTTSFAPTCDQTASFYCFQVYR